MSAFDLWRLLFKRSLRLIWVCAVFALLFAVVFFVGFVREDMLDGLYQDIIEDVGTEYVIMKCEYSSTLSTGDAKIGVYYSTAGETYDVTLSLGETEVKVDRYSRGLNVCKALPEWQNYVIGEELAQSEDAIWLFDPYATTYDISVGDSITITAENFAKNFRVAGTYTADMVRYLRTGFAPSFLVTYGETETAATIVCTVNQIYPLYKSALGKTVTDDDGVMDLCEGYCIAEIGFTLLFCLFVLFAVLLLIKMIHFIQNNLSMQSFLLSVFGMSAKRQWIYSVSILAVFGCIALGLSIGIFYIFVAVAQSLASSIMNMVFGEIAIGWLVLCGYLVYLAVTAFTVFFSARKNQPKQGGM